MSTKDLIERVHAACTGHPYARIAWPHRILHEAADALASQAAEIERLREALKPFAKEADEWRDSCSDDFVPVLTPDVSDDGDRELATFNIGDLRRARAALNGENA